MPMAKRKRTKSKAGIREALLPKLLSSEIRVKDEGKLGFFGGFFGGMLVFELKMGLGRLICRVWVK